MKKIMAFLMVCCLFAGTVTAQETVMRMYKLGFADPDTMESAARLIAGDTGRVLLERKTGKMLFEATPAQHEEVAELLRQLDVPPRNIQIEVEFLGQSSSSTSGASLGGQVAITLDGQQSTQGSLTAGLSDRSTRQSGHTKQMLLVADGREASLRVGETVPYLDWFNQWGIQNGLFTAEIRWQEVGSFLVVQPTLVGDGPMIRIRLTPELSGRVDGHPHRTRFAQVATEVFVRSGQTVKLGGLDTRNDFYSRFLIGFDQSGQQQSLDIRLTPTLQ